MSLARGAARGAAWNFITVLVERAFGFVILGILLRTIPASVVGLVAIGFAIADLARVAANSGAGEQVQAFAGDREVEAGAFWSQAIASVLLMAVISLAANDISFLYGQPQLALVLQVVSLNIFITSFVIVPSARLAAKFQFRTLGLISVGSTVLGGLTALPFAFAGRGIDALVLQRVVGVAFYAVTVSIAARWLPPKPPRLAAITRSLSFSLPLMQAALVDYVSVTGYVMLLGLRLPVAELGLFRIAQRLVEVLQEVAFLPANKVFMPVFVAVRDNPARRFETTRQLLDLLTMIIFFIAALTGAAAHPIVLLMFGNRWAAAAPVFAILTLVAPAAALYGIVNPLLTAAGRTQLVSTFAWINAFTIVSAAWLAAPFGLVVLAWVLAVRSVLSVALILAALSAGLGRPAWPLLRLLLLPALALAAARLAAALVLAALHPGGLLAQLAVAVGVATVVFGAVVLACAPRRVVEMTLRLHRALLGQAILER